MSADEEPTQLSKLGKILNPGGAGREAAAAASTTEGGAGGAEARIVAVNVTSKLTHDGPILEIVVVEEVRKSVNHPFKGMWGFVRGIFAAFMLFIILAALFLGFGLISLVICVIVAIFSEEKRDHPEAKFVETCITMIMVLCFSIQMMEGPVSNAFDSNFGPVEGLQCIALLSVVWLIRILPFKEAAPVFEALAWRYFMCQFFLYTAENPYFQSFRDVARAICEDMHFLLKVTIVSASFYKLVTIIDSDWFDSVPDMTLEGGPHLFTFKRPEIIGKALNQCKIFAEQDKTRTACKLPWTSLELPWSKLFIVAVGQYPLENFLKHVAHTGIGMECLYNSLFLRKLLFVMANWIVPCAPWFVLAFSIMQGHFHEHFSRLHQPVSDYIALCQQTEICRTFVVHPTMQAFMNDPCVNFFFFSRPFLHRFRFSLFDDFISIFAGVLLLLQVLMKPLLQLWQVLWSFFFVAWKALANIWKTLKSLLDIIWPFFQTIWELLKSIIWPIFAFIFSLDVPNDVWKWIVDKKDIIKRIILIFLLVASAIVLIYVFVW